MPWEQGLPSSGSSGCGPLLQLFPGESPASEPLSLHLHTGMLAQAPHGVTNETGNQPTVSWN